MSGDLTDDQELLQETARRFLETTCPLPEVRRLADAEPAGFDRAWWARAAGLGWTGLLVPEDQGGGNLSGAGVVDLALVAEEAGRLVAPGPMAPTALVAAAIAEGGSEPVRRRWLGPLLSGEAVGAWCLEEPGAWDGAGGACRVQADGTGFRLHGGKRPVEAGGQADVLLVMALGDDGTAVEVVVPADAPGVTVTALQGLDLVRRHAAVTFDGVVVPGDGVLTPSSRSVPDLLYVAVLLQCAEMVGAAGAMLERTVAYAFDRCSFGRPLASYQALKHRFADLTVWYHAALSVTRGAAQALDDARAGTGDGAAAVELVQAAKVYVGEHVPRLLQDCVQLHGGIGVTWDHDLHLYLRRAVQHRLLLGTPDDHAERIAAGLRLGGSEEAA